MVSKNFFRPPPFFGGSRRGTGHVVCRASYRSDILCSGAEKKGYPVTEIALRKSDNSFYLLSPAYCKYLCGAKISMATSESGEISDEYGYILMQTSGASLPGLRITRSAICSDI